MAKGTKNVIAVGTGLLCQQQWQMAMLDERWKIYDE
jgi:hypothetical protein